MFKARELVDFQKENTSSYGITIGNFDGVHLGHKDLLSQFHRRCVELNIRPVILTFRPHPALLERKFPFLLTDYDKKVELLQINNSTIICELSFNKNFKNLSGKEFIAELLNDSFLKLIFVGHDFALGKNKDFNYKHLLEMQNVSCLREQAEKFSLKNCITPSSSLIRLLLGEAKIEEANNILGRPFTFQGKRILGKQLGRKIGFPTVNLSVGDTQYLPPVGVYIASTLVNMKTHPVALNIGKNPTVETTNNIKIEAHIIGYKGEFEDVFVEITLYQKLRNEIKFDSIEKLKTQISKDVAKTERYFS